LGIAVSFAAVISIIFLLPRAYAGFQSGPLIKKRCCRSHVTLFLHQLYRNIFWTIPTLALPIMVVNLLGAVQNAFFYVAWSVGGIVFMIPR